MSNAVANQAKFIHAHQMAKNSIANDVSPCSTCPALNAWCSWADALLTATTNTRSKNNSSELATR